MFLEPWGPVTGNSSKLAVLVYCGSFVNYYSLILGPAAIRTFREPRCVVTWNSSKHAVLAYSGHFCILLVTHFGFRCDPNVFGTPGSGYGELVKTRSFALFWQFCKLLLTDFGSRWDPNVSGTPVAGYAELVKTRSFGLFSPVLCAITH